MMSKFVVQDVKISCVWYQKMCHGLLEQVDVDGTDATGPHRHPDALRRLHWPLRRRLRLAAHQPQPTPGNRLHGAVPVRRSVQFPPLNPTPRTR